MRLQTLAACLLATAFIAIVPGTSATPDNNNSQCNNNGIVIGVSVSGNNSYNCEASWQFCDQGTGAGAGAGAGGPGENDAGAEAAASGDCHQGNSDPGDDETCTSGQVLGSRNREVCAARQLPPVQADVYQGQWRL